LRESATSTVIANEENTAKERKLSSFEKKVANLMYPEREERKKRK